MAKEYLVGPFTRKARICRGTAINLELKGVLQPRRNLVGRRIYTENDLEVVRDYYGQGEKVEKEGDANDG